METAADIKDKVLYVDDIKANLMLFEASFEDEFDIAIAESGEEALKLLEKNEFAVVVSDQNMPGMSGTELLEIVASEYPDIMRFMITAYTDYSTVVDSINKGQVYGYFNKPYNIDEVRLTIFKSLEIRNLRFKNQEMIKSLERVNEELLEMDKTKIDFLSGITNEIRNPINKIMTAVHMIKDRVDSRELTESLHLLDLSLGRLESFAESAKLLVSLNESSAGIKREKISLKEMLEVGIVEKRDHLKVSGLSFKVNDYAGKNEAEGEFDLLLAAFLILMDLVISHAVAESEILFSIKDLDDNLSLGIKNTQSNFSQKEIDLLSDMFSNGDGSFKKDSKMELVLAHRIVNAHGGRLQIGFEEDKSTLVQMILPVSVS